MERSKPRVLLTIGAGFGALAAFPLGLYLGRSGTAAPPTALRAGNAAMRDHYSPALLSDPYVIDQFRLVVEAMETGCRETGTRCVEARTARRRLIALERR